MIMVVVIGGSQRPDGSDHSEIH